MEVVRMLFHLTSSIYWMACRETSKLSVCHKIGLDGLKKRKKLWLAKVSSPLSIEKYYTDVVYNVVDIKEYHLVFGKPWQFDHDSLHKRRDNIY